MTTSSPTTEAPNLEAPVHGILHSGDDIAIPLETFPNPEIPMFKDVGSTWVTTYKDVLWPVVLCKEDSVPEGFKLSRRGDHEMPAILLGRHKYIWVMNENLREFDPGFEYLQDAKSFDEPDIVSTDDEVTRFEKQRQTAFRQDARAFQDDVYWQNYIRQKSKARKLEAEISAQQRKATPKRKRRHESYDDEDESRSSHKRRSTGSVMGYKDVKRHLMTPKSSGRKGKGRMPGIDHLFSSGDEDERDEANSNGLFTPRSSDDVFTEKSRQKQAPLKKRSGNNDQLFAPPPMGPDMCRVLIDANRTGVIIPLTSLELCPYLLDRQTMDKTANEHIVDLRADPRALELGLTEEEFYHIYEYCHTQDLKPDRTGVPHKTDSTTQYAQKLGLAFKTASKIQHDYLQEVIQEKLCNMRPLPSLAILIVARIICRVRLINGGTKVEKFLRQWIIDHVAYDFWTLAKHDSQQLQSVMADFEDLRKVVLEKVAEGFETAEMTGT